MVYIRFFLISAALFSLVSCSSPKIFAKKGSVKSFAPVETFHTAPLIIAPTLADTSALQTDQPGLIAQINDIVRERGYSPAPRNTADTVLRIKVGLDANDMTSKEDLRFMKGVRGGNFPDANPRIRATESDLLRLDLINSRTNVLIYTAKCRLIEKQENLSDGLAVRREDVLLCVREIASAFPQK